MDQSSQVRPLLVTHSGTFHLDDVFAYVVLRAVLGVTASGQDHSFTRTRDKETMTRANYVWDVGNAYDPPAGRFDHHQRGAPVRDDGVPLSAAGLVWRHHGATAVMAMLAPTPPSTLAAAIAAEIDRDVVHRIDEIDNGVKDPEDTLGLSSLVADYNPLWSSEAVGDQQAEDAAFLRASEDIARFLRQRIEAVRARLEADTMVQAAHVAASDKRILELCRKMPWQDAVSGHGLSVLLAVYPVSDGNWVVDAMPSGSASYRVPMPQAWAGLRDDALVAMCGVEDAVFVHPQRFLGVARTHTGAMAMADKAIVIVGS